MTDLKELMLKKAESFYLCATDLDDQIREFKKARDLLQKFGDQYSELAGCAGATGSAESVSRD